MSKISLKILPYRARKEVYNIRDIANFFGYSSYIVGGTIRDILLGEECFDIDILIVGNAMEVAKCYQEKYQSEVTVYERFLSARVSIDDEDIKNIDIISARSETYVKPGSLPLVDFGSLEEDLKRRDFTVNTLAYHLEKDEIIDKYGGIKDLEQGIIRVLDSESFIEDPTRILRAIRYKNRYSFSYDITTYSLLLEAIIEKCLTMVSNDRVKKELFKTLKETAILPIILEYKDLGLLYDILFIRELAPIQLRCLQEVLRYKKTEDTLLTNLLILYINANREIIKQFCESYGIKQSLYDVLLQTRSILEQVHILINQKDMDLSSWQIYNLFSDKMPEQLLIVKLFIPHSKKYIEYYEKHLKKVHLFTDGKILKKLGLKPGPKYQYIFKELLQKKMEKGWVSKEEEIEYIMKNMKKWR